MADETVRELMVAAFDDLLSNLKIAEADPWVIVLVREHQGKYAAGTKGWKVTREQVYG